MIVMVTIYLESKGPCVHEITCTVGPAQVWEGDPTWRGKVVHMDLGGCSLLACPPTSLTFWETA